MVSGCPELPIIPRIFMYQQTSLHLVSLSKAVHGLCIYFRHLNILRNIT